MGRLDHNEPPSSSPDPVLQRPKWINFFDHSELIAHLWQVRVELWGSLHLLIKGCCPRKQVLLQTTMEPTIRPSPPKSSRTQPQWWPSCCCCWDKGIAPCLHKGQSPGVNACTTWTQVSASPWQKKKKKKTLESRANQTWLHTPS